MRGKGKGREERGRERWREGGEERRESKPILQLSHQRVIYFVHRGRQVERRVATF